MSNRRKKMSWKEDRRFGYDPWEDAFFGYVAVLLPFWLGYMDHSLCFVVSGTGIQICDSHPLAQCIDSYALQNVSFIFKR